MDSNPICHPSPAQKKWNAHFWITFNFWWWAGWLMDSYPIPSSLQPKKWNAQSLIMFNFWWSAGLVDGLKPQPPPLSSQKNEMLVFGLYSLQMIGWAGQWNRTPSTTPLQPKNWNAHFWITFKFWSAGLVDGLEPHLPPLSSQKKWNVHFWMTFNFWWSAGLVDGLEPHLPPLSNQKNEMLIFGLHSTSDDWPRWWMDSNPICHPSPAKKMKCSFLVYIQLLMIGWAGWWTQTPSATPLQPEKWNTCFWIIFTSDDWLGWSMDLNPIHHHSPAKKMKCLFLDYIQLLMISWADQWTRTPSATPLQPKNWNAHFWITFKFWSAGLVDGLEPHLPPLSSQKNEMFTFGWRSTSDDRLGWSMDLNPICHPSPTKKMKCSFLDYIQLLMSGCAGGWPRTPSATPLEPKKWNAHFWFTFNFWWSAELVNGLKPHLPPLSSQKNEMLIFGLLSTSDDQLGWSMHSNPICHLSPAKKTRS